MHPVGGRVVEAESLLRAIATDLERMPLDERTGPLHLRVLALKRVVTDWSVSEPAEPHATSVMDSLQTLRSQVLEMRRTTSGVRVRSTTPLPRAMKLK
jgi:hypothetical protein